MKYEKEQLKRLNEIDAVKLRDRQGNQTNWLNVNDIAKEQGINEILTSDKFSFYYNMLERSNGFTNIFTYLLSCEIDSNRELLNEFVSIAENDVYECEKYMKEYYETIPIMEERSHETLLNVAVDCVNFTELAHYFANYNEN